jgi:hypothetical protein
MPLLHRFFLLVSDCLFANEDECFVAVGRNELFKIFPVTETNPRPVPSSNKIKVVFFEYNGPKTPVLGKYEFHTHIGQKLEAGGCGVAHIQIEIATQVDHNPVVEI